MILKNRKNLALLRVQVLWEEALASIMRGNVLARELTVFEHIFKTAGTTFLISYLCDAFPMERTFIIRGSAPFNALDRRAAVARAARRDCKIEIIGGHNCEEIRHRFPKARYITLVREPVSRFISRVLHHLYHNKEGPPVEEIDIREFTASAVPRSVECLLGNKGLPANDQTSILLGEQVHQDRLTGALFEKIDERFHLVGLTERFADFLFLLHVELDWPLVLVRNRMVREERKRFILRPGDSELIATYNRLDAELYARIAEQFEARLEVSLSRVQREKLERYRAAMQAFQQAPGAAWVMAYEDCGSRSPTMPFSEPYIDNEHVVTDQDPSPVSRVIGNSSKCGTMPLVSVIIPVFNRADSIMQAVQSVLAQSHAEFELIIVDDGSTDAVMESLSSVSGDPRVLLVQHESNRGAGAARNTAISHAKGRYLAFLDSDDEWHPEKLQHQLAFMQAAPDPWKACCTGYRLLTHADSKGTDVLPDATVTLDDLLWGCRLSPGSTLMVVRSLFDVVGLFDEDLRRLEDWEWLLRCTKHTPVAGLPEILARVVHRSYTHVGVDQVASSVQRMTTRVRQKHYCLPKRKQALLLSSLENERAAINYRHGRFAVAFGALAISLWYYPWKGWKYFARLLRTALQHMAADLEPGWPLGRR